MEPIDPPPESHLILDPAYSSDWTPVSFMDEIEYVCLDYEIVDPLSGEQIGIIPRYFSHEALANRVKVQCAPTGRLTAPDPWPFCVTTNDCNDPPLYFGVNMEVNNVGTLLPVEVRYSCGPYKAFVDQESKTFYDELLKTCQWDSSYFPQHIDPCKRKHTK